MSAFAHSVLLQWRLDIRNRGVFITYYVVPLVFFVFMGGVFTSIMPDAYRTIIQSMTVFGITMGAVLGSPVPLVELYHSEIKKGYRVGNIPLWTIAASNFISGFSHLMIMSVIIFLAAPVLFDARLPDNLWLYLLATVLTIAASLCVGTLFGLFVKSASRLTMIAQLVFLPSVVLSGIMFPVDLLPDAMRYVGMIFPATSGFALMSENQIDGASVAAYVVPLLLTISVCAGISAWKVRRIGVD
jgi:ABC-2 type transport system permease protein